jgi:hypothetical protein
MKKAKRILSVLVLMTAIALWAGSFPSLFAQTAKEAQAAQEASTAAAQTLAVQLKAAQERRAAEAQELTMRVKTYELKFINASEFMRSARFYVVDSTGTESSLTVRIFERNIPEFEALLKKLDVEKRNIQFQVYTIIASKDQPLERFKNNFVSETQGIADKDLKRVLDEMKGLWNFKYYWVDSPSFLVVKDGAAGSMFKLVSLFDFDMNVLRVQLRGDEPGKRIISVGQIKLSQTTDQHSTLIDTSDVTFKEKGYLVVGVSGFQAGWSSSALILVISAEIK